MNSESLYMHYIQIFDIMRAQKLIRITYSWLCQLLDLLNFCVWDDVKVAHNVWAIPLILLFDRFQQKAGVMIVVIVTTEQPALPSGGLFQKKAKQQKKVGETDVYFVS